MNAPQLKKHESIIASCGRTGGASPTTGALECSRVLMDMGEWSVVSWKEYFSGMMKREESGRYHMTSEIDHNLSDCMMLGGSEEETSFGMMSSFGMVHKSPTS